MLETLNKNLQYAIVADSRMQGLANLLDEVIPHLPPKLNLWLSEREDNIVKWAEYNDIPVKILNEYESLSLIVPTLPFPLEITRYVLEPVQLLFIGRNQITKDGYFLGALYSMLNLVPLRFQKKIKFYLPDVLSELYIRFHYFPAIIPSNRKNPRFLTGDAWQLDDIFLKNSESKYSRLHFKLEKYMRKPESLLQCQKGNILPARTNEKLFSQYENIQYCLKDFIKPAAAYLRASDILYQIISFRMKYKWKIWKQN